MSREVEVTGKAIEGVRILEEKATRFADEFDMDGRRGMLGMFPSSLTFHWEPRTSYRICKSQLKNENYSKHIRDFKTGRVEVGSLLSLKFHRSHRSQAREANPG